jgi:hypothetical protein
MVRTGNVRGARLLTEIERDALAEFIRQYITQEFPEVAAEYAKVFPKQDFWGFLQRQPADAAFVAPAAVARAQTDQSPGRQLDPAVRRPVEARLGASFAQVRVHTDRNAEMLAAGLHARAFTRGRDIYFASGAYAPDTPGGKQLLAHELVHTVQQAAGRLALEAGPPVSSPDDPLEREAERVAEAVVADAPTPAISQGPARLARVVQLQPQSKKPGAPTREMSPQSRLTKNAERLRLEALPAFQRALDTVEEAAVADAGAFILALWAVIEGANAELLLPETVRAPDAPDLPEFAAIRSEVLAGVTLQRFRGENVAGPVRRIEYAGDVGQFIATQTREATETVHDAKNVLFLLGKQPVPYNDQKTTVDILSKYANPWQLGYLFAVMQSADLEPVINTFDSDTTEDLRAIIASQEFNLKREFISPADRIGVLEPMASLRKVRLLKAYGARELALELYNDYSFYAAVLVPYNRGVLEHMRPEALLPAGTELLIEPRLVVGRYQLVFMTAEMSKRQLDRPYIEADPIGGVIAGTKSRYTVRWPVTSAPEDAMRLSTGVLLWQPIRSGWEYGELNWSVENDPAVVQAKGLSADEFLERQVAKLENLSKEGSSFERVWSELGTYTIRCQVRFGLEVFPTEFDLRYPQPVVNLGEKVNAEWLTVADPRLHQEYLLGRRAETYGDFQRAAAELGVTEEELAQNPRQAVGINTSYYPEFFVRDLRKQLDATGDDRTRRKLNSQIDAVESAIARTKLSPMRPITALWVSSDKERTQTVPLSLYVSPDPDAPNWCLYPLRVWDFTIPGQAREYTDGHGEVTASQSLHEVFKSFANEAPYADGTVRVELESLLLPEEYVHWSPVARETLDLHTHGGTRLEKYAGGIATGLAVGASFALGGPAGALIALQVLGVYGAVTSLADIITRLDEGTFEWDIQTGLDILGIFGGLTAIASPVISSVRGVGSVAWLGTSARATSYLQIGVMAGMHSKRLIEAIGSGKWDKIEEAAFAAFLDGALFAVAHKAGKAVEAEARARAFADPAFEGVQGGTLGESGEISGRASTAAGVGGGRPPGRPPGQEPPASARTGTPRDVHEQWARSLSETGLSPRPGPGEPAGPPVTAGPYETVQGERTFPTPEAAFAAYDQALARAGGREVGIYRRVGAPTGEYVVRVGDEHSVTSPADGRWESVLHRHPNPENVLTRRMPAPQDVQNTVVDVFRSGRPITEFIDYPLPDGRRGLVAYTVEPTRGRVTIKYERADGSQVVRTFDSLEAYAKHYAERTTYVDPKSPEYQWMMRDLNDFYARREPSGAATATGVLKLGAAPEGEGTAPVDVPSEAAKVKPPPSEPVAEPAKPPQQPESQAQKEAHAQPEKAATTAQAKPAATAEALATTAEAVEAQAEAAVQLEAKARQAYRDAVERASKAGRKFEGKSEDEFVAMYRDGKIYDVTAGKGGQGAWVNAEKSAKAPPEKFAADTTPDVAFKRLAGEGSTSTFKKYFEMLKKLGIADETAIKKDLETLVGKTEVTVDKVRHTLKTKYRNDLLDALWKDASGKPLDAKGSHARMLEILGELHSADKGTLAEDWLQRLREQTDATAHETPQQIVVRSKDQPGMQADRRLDRIEGEAINEVKSGDGSLKDSERDELTDHLGLVGQQGATIDVGGGKTRTVKSVKWSFLSPEGGARNADWMVLQLKRSQRLSFEVWNGAGETRVFTQADVFDASGAYNNQLHEFLGLVKKP